MNKVIFQIGLLAFCVAFVMFSAEGNDALQAAQRGFVVFALVVGGIAVLLFAASSLSVRRSIGAPTVTPGVSAGGHESDGNAHPAA